MTRSQSGSETFCFGNPRGAVDAFDSNAVLGALRRSSPEIAIDRLTALAKNPAEFASVLPRDRRLRFEGGGNVVCLCSFAIRPS
jgi:hypothetical protein